MNIRAKKFSAAKIRKALSRVAKQLKKGVDELTTAEQKAAVKAARETGTAAGTALSKTQENRGLTEDLKTAKALVAHYAEDPWDGNYMLAEDKFQ